MDYNSFKEEFIYELEKIDSIDLKKFDEEKYKMFFEYMNNILSWNEKINVTAVKDEKEFILKHYIDSLVVQNYILNDKSKMLDIGTGAGFPGIPLKLYKTELKMVLIDSVNKKLNVINDSIKTFGLNDIEIIHTRAEDLAFNNNYRECFDIVTTRAVSKLSTIVEYMLPFLKIGGRAICMKGPNYKEELVEANKAIKILGGNFIGVDTYNIGDNERNIIVIEKIKNTPKNYPRKNNKPLKEPIK